MTELEGRKWQGCDEGTADDDSFAFIINYPHRTAVQPRYSALTREVSGACRRCASVQGLLDISAPDASKIPM